MDRAATISLTVDAALIEEARQKGLDLSALLERALRRELLGSSAHIGAETWQQENAEAIEAWNDDVRRNGLWSETLRQF